MSNENIGQNDIGTFAPHKRPSGAVLSARAQLATAAHSMSRPLSAHGHIDREPYGRAVISPFGGYVHVPVPAPPQNKMRPYDGAKAARTTLNPAKAAAGHAEMHSREYGTGGKYAFREAVKGVLPGYAGHRPGARDVHHTMAFGGVPTFNTPRSRTPPGQGSRLNNRPTTSFQELGCGWKLPEEKPNENFRDAVGGVLAGYTGFVPCARTHFGSSHVGGLADVGDRGHAPQRGHATSVERYKDIDLSARTLRTSVPVVGYQVGTARMPSRASRRALAPSRHPLMLHCARVRVCACVITGTPAQGPPRVWHVDVAPRIGQCAHAHPAHPAHPARR